jgi:hypothetical protein
MMYYNFPCNPTELWVMAFNQKTKTNKFLFYAKIGSIQLNNGNDAWNPTDFERAVKQKCQNIRKQTGGKYTFEFNDHYQMNRYIKNETFKGVIDFPLDHYNSTLNRSSF